MFSTQIVLSDSCKESDFEKFLQDENQSECCQVSTNLESSGASNSSEQLDGNSSAPIETLKEKTCSNDEAEDFESDFSDEELSDEEFIRILQKQSVEGVRMIMAQIKENQATQEECCDHNSNTLLLQTRPLSSSKILSKGSSLHESGQCNPCGFFFKPSGCSLGSECEFCHLCTKTMFLQRKKARKLMGKEIKRAAKNIRKEEELLMQKSPILSVKACATPTRSQNFYRVNESSLPAIKGSMSQPIKNFGSKSNVTSSMQLSNKFSNKLNVDSKRGVTLSNSLNMYSPFDGMKHTDASRCPSVGSALHSSGQCLPCTKLIQTGSCAEGEACAFCHICQDTLPTRLDKSSRFDNNFGDIWRIQKTPATTLDPVSQSTSRAQSIDTRYTTFEQVVRAELIRDMSNPGIFDNISMNDNDEEDSHDEAITHCVPNATNIGSRDHHLGTCNPCVFIHKKTGCKSGDSCNHCHICDSVMFRLKKATRAKVGKRIKKLTRNWTGQDIPHGLVFQI
jgi:hypothetical protein